MSADPLAGRREEINRGDAYSLMWSDKGEGCPVEEGQVFELRSCRIQITKTHRVQINRRKGEHPPGWYWRAEFTRYRKADRPVYLARKGGTTTDLKQAMDAQDDEDPGTVQKTDTKHATLGKQPEPEAVPGDEVRDLRGSRESRQRHEHEMAERRMQEADAPLEQRLARLREMANRRHVDISSELRVIERRIAKAEGKVSERAAA